MSERFDTLFSGMSEETARSTLLRKPSELDNPGLKYLAATRLGACTSAESFELLLEAGANPSDDLYERITRRKALDALGRRKNPKALPVLLDALRADDEPTVVNAADAIARIGIPVDINGQVELIRALEGPDNQRRAVIQAFTRLGMADRDHAIDRCRQDTNPLVAGAAHAHRVRVEGNPDGLSPLISQLQDDNPGRRRAAVIDLGDAGRVEALAPLIRCPVSMPLRAKSAFLMATTGRGSIEPKAVDLLEQLLQDDPRRLDLDGLPPTEAAEDAIRDGLQHRDEARQYAAAKALMTLPKEGQLNLIDGLRSSLGSDYGVHYLLASCTGLLHLHERSDLVRAALAETAPQYAKSRVAAAWSCLRLGLGDQRSALQALSESNPWQPLRWSCERALLHLA
ncbi:MAG: HEAT repeat domain-containing protein [Synechococcus sp. BS301-5m-G54]|nr:HEAT repeat domain-containing protein [Synechococcus sp. BS301-5m-G54]MBL6796210.1 HEAT repeat domain-containing protein [Synechococcus sp. BS307-5m-G34]MBL6798929.1 HEAT repeat domain-containing protein [Synechococcus sp. BS307-5m-G39]